MPVTAPDDLWTRATSLGTPEQVEQLRRALEVAHPGLVVPPDATLTEHVVRADGRPLEAIDLIALGAALTRITGAAVRIVQQHVVTAIRAGGDRARAAIERAARRERVPIYPVAVIRVSHPRPRGGRRPGAGRPRSDDAATARLEVRLTPGELEELRARADEAGQAVSEYVRDALFLAAPKG